MADAEFDWEDYLVLARNLVDHISGEASARTASSRAYYAAYWKARLILEANQIVLPRTNIHTFVWDAFMNSWNNAGASLGKSGNRMKGYRVKADYYASPAMTRRDAEAAVVRAESLVEDLKQISAAAQSAAVKRANELIASSDY